MKTTSKKIKNKDNLKNFKIEDDLKQKNQDDLKKNQKLRRPQKK